MSRVETVANKNPRGGLAYTRWTFLNNNNNLFVMGFVVCERFPLSVCESPPLFVYWRRFLISVQRPRWLGEKEVDFALKWDRKRHRQKDTTATTARPGPALKEGGVENWRIFSFLLGSTKEMVKGLSHHRMIITGVLFYIFMSLRSSSSSSSWLSLPVSSLSAPAEVDRFAPWPRRRRRRGRRRLW